MSLERYEPGEVEQCQDSGVEPVLEGELVDEPPARPVHRRVVEARVVRSTTRVVTHQHTRTAGRWAGRQVSYVLAGVWLLVRRAADSRTNSFHHRMLRAAEATQDWDRIGEWEARSERARRARHDRRMDWLEAPAKLVKAAAIGVVSLAVLLIAIGVIGMAGSQDMSAFLEPFVFVFQLAQWVAMAVAVAWTPLVVLLPWLVVAACWWMGRQAGAAPAWLQTAGQAAEAPPVDERAIAHALQHLGISPLTQYFKKGGVLAYVSIPATDGLGVAASVRMPDGVAAVEVVGRKVRLAANLGRDVTETWPSVGIDAGVLDIWVANRHALDGGAGPWPLLDTGTVDVLEGVPTGITMRGTQVIAPIDGTSWLIGGRPGQGKSNLARLLIMGACLDPTTEIWCYVFATNADYDALAERFTRYHVGMGNNVAEAAVGALGELVVELERRGDVMREKGVDTAAAAGFHELIVVLDECHRLFQHRTYGTEASLLGEDLVKQARKYGVILILITQSPTATSIPKEITREVICRVAYSCVDHIGNDALLGSGMYSNGVRATELRPGSRSAPGDRGKCLTVGVVPDVDWSLMLAHKVEGSAVNAIAERALAVRRDYGARGTTVTTAPRDLLDDLSAVLGNEPVPAADVPALLRDYAPDAAVYRAMTGKQLRERLARLDVKVPSTNNRYPVDPAAIRDAIARGASDAS